LGGPDRVMDASIASAERADSGQSGVQFSLQPLTNRKLLLVDSHRAAGCDSIIALRWRVPSIMRMLRNDVVRVS